MRWSMSSWVALFVAGSLSSAAAQSVPTLDVRQSCRGGSDGQSAYESCLRSEEDAKRTLTETWAQYTPAMRRECAAEGGGSLASYVEILTCLQIGKAVRGLSKENDDLGPPTTIAK